MILDVNTKEKEMIADALDAMTVSSKGAKLSAESAKLCAKVRRSMKKIKPRSAKNKGADFQKTVCSFIADILGIPFDNTDDGCLIHSRTMGCSGSDVELRGEARSRFPFGIECKNTNTLSVPEWIRQAASNAIDGRWLLFIKSARLDENVVIMKMDTFKEICKKGV